MAAKSDVVLVVHTRQRPTGNTAVAGGIEYTLRRWSCTLQEGRPRSSTPTQLPYVKRVEFVLHETFPDNHRVVSRAPFSVQEEGWGEFDLDIIVHFYHCAETMRIVHDLNFHEGESYFKEYQFAIPSPSPAFLSLFNKRSPVSRKTIPSRGSKARKGPPRDSVYSKSHRSPHSSESLDAHSADDRGLSDSESASGSDSDSNGNASASASDSDLDSHSSGGASKSRSASSASGRRAKDLSVRSSGSIRPSFSTKHVPQPSSVAAAAAQQPGVASHKQRPSLSSIPSRSLQGDHAEDSRRQRSPPASIRAPSKPERDSLPNARRALNAMPATLGGMTKHRRSPTETPPKQRTSATVGAASTDRKSTSTLRDRSLDKSLLPANLADRPAAASALSGVKRRLSDALDSASSKSSVRRRTLAPGDARMSSVSPPLAPADARADAAMPVSRRPLASGIAKVKVPKKRDRLLAEDRDRDLDLLPASKAVRSATGPGRKQVSRPLDADERMSSPPQQQQQGAALTSREIFIRERERQRYLEQARDASAAGSAGIRQSATKPTLSLSSSSSTSSSSSSMTAAAAGLVRGMRAPASTTTAAVLSKTSKAAAQGFSDDETADRPADVTRRKTIRRDLVGSAVSAKQSLPKHNDTVAEATPVDSPPKMSISRERKPTTTTAGATSLMRVKRTLSAENKKAARADQLQTSRAVSSAAQSKIHDGSADATDGEVLAAQLARRMERIMERANLLNEHALVDFLRLLHTLRVEQDPEMADRITEEAVDLVENNGEYSCNLSSLRPEAIDRLWAFVR